MKRQGETRIIKTSSGEFHFKNGLLHRLDGPAARYSCGIEEWYKDGLLNRYPVDGVESPAVTNAEGQFYYIAGRLHRINGPAFVKNNGVQKYYNYGKLHRTDGPAHITSSGMEYYYVFGKEVKRIDLMNTSLLERLEVGQVFETKNENRYLLEWRWKDYYGVVSVSDENNKPIFDGKVRVYF